MLGEIQFELSGIHTILLFLIVGGAIAILFFEIKKLKILVRFFQYYLAHMKNYLNNKQEYADFWIALLHLGMKVGKKFAPHAKIS